MTGLIEKAANFTISRRSFLKASAVGVAGLGLTGCGNSLSTMTEGQKIDTEKGEWIPAACWHNCGGRCLNKALVVDGIVVRQKTDDTHEDSFDFPQQRGCLRGRSQRKQIFGVDRLKYPMKRKNWSPDNPNGNLRGQDEWERISWDEALDYIANEIKRIQKSYGTESIYANGEGTNLLGCLGSYYTNWGTASFGSWWTAPIYGIQDGCVWVNSLNDRMDLRNCDYVLAFGMNPAWSSMGNACQHYLSMKKAGTKFIFIDPIYTSSASMLDAEWLPIRPGTDSALLFGMAHSMLISDNLMNPIIDWEFLHKSCVGFDAESMPANARTNENFKDYVLGKYDGIPKNAEWASEICGMPATDIKRLAVLCSKNNKVAMLTGWSTARTNNSDNLPQLFMTVAAMGGHFGKPGHTAGVSCHALAGNLGPALVIPGPSSSAPSSGFSAGVSTPRNPAKQICDAELWQAIQNKEYTPNPFIAGALFNPFWQQALIATDISKPIEKQAVDIKMLWHGYSAVLQTRDSMAQGIKVHRNAEFVACQSQFLTTNAKYSDIVLPVTTMWERGPSIADSTNRDIMIVCNHITEPLYEAKDDSWIIKELGKRFDIAPEFLYPLDDKQKFFNQICGATVIKEDGSGYEPLVKITNEDIAEWGYPSEPHDGRISFKELQEQGIYQVKRYEGDPYGFIAYKELRDNPESKPLNTVSGKFEIYCQSLSDIIRWQGYNEISPYPKYVPPTEGYEDTYSDFHDKSKGDFPYQIFNPHYLRRSHTVFDNNIWLRDACPNPVFISQEDAKAKGLVDGDTVLITSPHGKVMRNASVTNRIMPGCIGLPHGAWVNVDETTGIDQSGADNYLKGTTPTGLGVSGWNTQICNIEKYNGAQLPPDIEVPLRIIFKEEV